MLLPGAGLSLPVRLGDLDEDTQATVLDVVRLVNHLNGTVPLAPELLPYADLNEDGAIDQMDVDLVGDAILEIRPLPNPFAPPQIFPPITSTNGASVIIAGTATRGRVVTITGGSANVSTIADNHGQFALNVPLQPNRLNLLFVTATNSTFASGVPQPLRVIQDSQAPHLFIDFPTNGQTLTTSNTVIAGRVGDMLSGFMGLNVTVSVVAGEMTDSGPGNVIVGIGNNGTFERGEVPLAFGTNLIYATATDVHGNSVTKELTVIRAEPANLRMVAVSGDMQNTNIHRRLLQPIVARIEDAAGVPFTNKVVTFTVTRSDGRLLPVDTNYLAHDLTLRTDYSSNGVMQLHLFTDTRGEARAWWRVGADAGCGNNRVCVSSRDIEGAAYFCASAMPAPAKQINVGTGNNQKAETGGFTPEPLRAWVSDSCNGVESIPVTFTVIQGGGKVNGQDAITIPSSRTGHAEVQFALGPDGGNNVVEANFAGNPGAPATFTAYGLVRDPARPTTFSGLILDNASQPIGGARCVLQVGNVNLPPVFSNPNGQFFLTNIPAGPAHLHVDGLVATSLGTNAIPQGTFPSLSYSMLVVPNAENSLPTPVLLPRLNPNNARVYYGTNDVVLTCEGMAGLKMFIKAGSMRRPDGSVPTPSDPAVVALNQVHHDDVPMPMPDGAAPPFAWTLGPGGSHFDPPITIEYPNMSALPAGSIAYFLSFNHDTERFEIVASGHVVDDGSKIVTDAGVGLSVAGWGCNCPPYAVTADCRPCPTISFWTGVRHALQFVKDVVLAFANVREAIRCASSTVDAATTCYETYQTVKRDNNLTPEEISAVLGCANSVKGAITQCAGLAPDVGGMAKRAQGISSALAAAITAAQRFGCLSTAANTALNAIALVNNSVNGLLSLASSLSVKHALTVASCRTLQHVIDTLNLASGAAAPEGHGMVANNSIPRLDQLFDQFQTELDASFLEDNTILAAATNTLPWMESESLFTSAVQMTDLSALAEFTLSVNGQAVVADANGFFLLPNVAAADQFGSGGPGTVPDFLSDDFVRMIGMRSVDGTNLYVFSDFFQLQQGQPFVITNFTFTDFPLPSPESIHAVPDLTTLTNIGQTTQVRVTATMNDGSTVDVTPRTRWTVYRTSNPGIATVNKDGLVTAHAKGMVFITAVNEGAATVCQIDVAPGELTSVSGIIRTANGTPAVGAVVRVVGQASKIGISRVDGSFLITDVATAFGPIDLAVEFSDGTSCFQAFLPQLAPAPSAATDAGIIVLRPSASPPGMIAWWPGDGNTEDIIGGHPGVLRNGATFGVGKVGQAFSVDGISQFIEVAHAPELNIPPNAPLTIEVWAYRTRNNLPFHIMGKRVGCGVPSSINYQLGFDNTVPRVETNVWVHIAYTYQGGTNLWYYDGALVASNIASRGPTNTATLKIGNSGTCSGLFGGLIDELALYNRVLSPSEIATIYQAGVLGKCKDLPPRVLRVSPGNLAIVSNVGAVSVTFNRSIAPDTLTSESFTLTAAGPDALFNTADDETITEAALNYSDPARTAFLNPSNALPLGLYRGTVSAALTSLSGKPLENPTTWTFWRLAEGPSGDDDLDGLTNSVEVSLGLNPLSRDTDGDGWSDDAELLVSSDPRSAASRPAMFALARPPTELVLPASTGTGAAGPNISIARPDVALVLPASKGAGGLPVSVTVAQPPIALALPANVSPQGAGTNIVVAQPSVSLVLPASRGAEGLAPGTTLANPPVAIVLPNATGASGLPVNTIVAKPPVKISFTNQSELQIKIRAKL